MFLTTLKEIKAKNLLRKYYLKQPVIKIDEIETISSIACIIALDELQKPPVLPHLFDRYGIKDKHTATIAYTKNPKTITAIGCPLFSLKNFNWKLRPKGGDISSFLDQEYDLLINYFTKEELPLLLLSTMTRAKVRVGFEGPNPCYNDLIFKINIHHDTLFRDELLKYLNIMNKL